MVINFNKKKQLSLNCRDISIDSFMNLTACQPTWVMTKRNMSNTMDKKSSKNIPFVDLNLKIVQFKAHFKVNQRKFVGLL